MWFYKKIHTILKMYIVVYNSWTLLPNSRISPIIWYNQKNNIIPTLKKAPKESHFKQLITKYTLIEFSPFISQNKHHTYLNSIKKTIFLYLLMKHINPKNPKMSIGVIQFRIICIVNDGLEITQYIMRINTLDSYALNFACKPNKLS